MPVIILPTSLRSRTEGRDRIESSGATVGECLVALERDQPGLKGWILDDRGRIRRHVNVFVDDCTVALDRKVGPDEEVFVIQAISGGAS